jgi:hypothetical protein
MRAGLFVAGALLLGSPAQAAGPAILLHGHGVQIYACTGSGGGVAWHLKAPDAVLTDAHGHVAGHHFAGPAWRASDGSVVVGEKLAESAAPAPGAVAWLILRAKSHQGAGVFADIAYIVRSQTEGGAAPATGCDAGHEGAEIRMGYNATYSFFPG